MSEPPATITPLDSIPNHYATAALDVIRMLFGLAVRAFEPWILRD